MTKQRIYELAKRANVPFDTMRVICCMYPSLSDGRKIKLAMSLSEWAQAGFEGEK